MLGVRSGLLEWFLAVLACVACAVFALVGAAQSSPAPKKVVAATTAPIATKPPVPAAAIATPVAELPTAKPAKTKVAVDLGKMGAVTLLRRVPLRAAPSSKAPALTIVGARYTLPITGLAHGWIHVMSPCELSGWIRPSDATLIPWGSKTTSPGKAVIVIDPGHGGSESGAIGPDGAQEQDVNLAIAKKLATQLKGSRVFLTRTGRYNVGLRFRALLASRLHASAFLSMHNNSGPVVPARAPGTQTWHQVKSLSSTRLASLVWSNLMPALSKYKVKWVSSVKVGPLGRIGNKGSDYYAVLRNSTVPAVIVESLFINNRAEERLLQNPQVQDTIASATATSVKTFIVQGGAANAKPYIVKMDRGGGLPAKCRDPQ